LQDMLVVSREQTQKLPAKVVEAALRADTAALPVFAGVDLGTQGYAIVKVVKVLPRDPALEATAKQERLQYAQWWTSAESLAFYNVLKERFKTEMKVAKPIRAAAGQQANPENATAR
jgi:peptidyl-prolyl cis-trans isomerase D